MKDQINTIRNFIESAYTTNWPRVEDRNAAHDAIEQLEAMVGSQEPVAKLHDDGYWTPMKTEAGRALNDRLMRAGSPPIDVYTAPVAQQYEAGDMASAAAQGFRDGVASVAQQPQEIEVQCPVCNHKFYEWPNDKQPQAEHDLKDVRCECCGYMTHHREHMGCIRAASKQPQAKAVWVNPELEHMAEEAECVSMCLNDRGVPSKDGSKPLSLWGRVQQYANPRFLGGMTTNTPIVSSEHIKSLAQVCRLIGNYTTTEFVQNVVGFAQVLLANKAVQEAFVKANTHLLYAAPHQAESVPVVDRVYEAAKRLVDHADFQLGGVLSAKSKARDIPSNAASKVKARHLASLRDALAKAPQQAEAVPMKTRRVTYTCPACAFSLERDE